MGPSASAAWSIAGRLAAGPVVTGSYRTHDRPDAVETPLGSEEPQCKMTRQQPVCLLVFPIDTTRGHHCLGDGLPVSARLCFAGARFDVGEQEGFGLVWAS